MRLAVDVCVGRRGAKLLREAGHRVICEAQTAEPDIVWLLRAIACGVDLVVSQDKDLVILCRNRGVSLFRVKQGWRARETVAELLAEIGTVNEPTDLAREVLHARRYQRLVS